MKKLLLFNYDWDADGFTRLAAKTGHTWSERFASRGFDLFSFPSNANLVLFDLDRFVNKLAKQAKKEGWTAVSSQNEQFGALAAALLAEKMGWPGTPPAAVVACQHKLYARQVLQQVCPEANVAFQRMPAGYGEAVPDGLTYPAFVKPVKAAFSVLAKVVTSKEDLHQFTRFGRYELWVIKRLVEPFERISKKILPQAGTAHSMILEEPANTANAQQYSLDGVAFAGDIKALGVVDSIMYPGTQAFMRFDYPSKLTQSVQDRALDVATKFLKTIGYSHGLFNMEFFYDAEMDKLTVIEFNPRMASQFADLYLRVDGVDLYAKALELAHGRNPWLLPRHMPTAHVATSAVYRVFDSAQPSLQQTIPPMPTPAHTAALTQHFPDHLLLHFPKTGGSTARDFKWLGSYRYGILHLGGQNKEELKSHLETASRLLGWPVPDHVYATAALSSAETKIAQTDLPTDIPTDLPTDLPTEIRTDSPTNWRLSA
jgi:Carbamoyl-phosphate synthase L chain, ATP binding domain